MCIWEVLWIHADSIESTVQTEALAFFRYSFRSSFPRHGKAQLGASKLYAL